MKKSLSKLHVDLYLGTFDFLFKFERIRFGIIWEVGVNMILPLLIALIWVNGTSASFGEMYVYVVLGFVVWNYWQTVLLSSTKLLFSTYQSNILNNPTAGFHYSVRLAISTFLSTSVIFAICLGVLASAGLITISWKFIGVFCVLLISSVVLIPCSHVLAVACARFRDFEKLVSLLLGLSIVATPVFWFKELLGRYSDFVYLNPIASHIELTRGLIIQGDEIFFPVLSLSLWCLGVGLVSMWLTIYQDKKMRFWIQ